MVYRRSSIGRVRQSVGLLLALACPGAVATADVVEIGASKDNTLYEDVEGSLSNGAGDHFFVGVTGMVSIRRGLIAFDVAAAVPAGSTIDSVTLTLNMSMTIVGPQTIELHRASADWGEGASDAPKEEGGGADAMPGDATWLHTSFDTDFWATLGGDFEPVASGSTLVSFNGPYTWDSTPDMVTDVQGWLDDPSTNFGWILTGDETTSPTTKRFDTRENDLLDTNPLLTVEFTTSIECEGDANGSGSVDPLDSGFVLARFGCPVGTGDPDCDAADVNHDGAVNPLDSGFVLARFGPCE